MLNTFHVRRSKEVECRQKGAADSARYLSHGRQARRQGEKLAYANFVIDLSTPARKFNFLPRAMFDTAIQRGLNLLDVDLFLDDFDRHSYKRAPDRERALSARESRYSCILHSPNLALADILQNRAHDTPQKKKKKKKKKNTPIQSTK